MNPKQLVVVAALLVAAAGLGAVAGGRFLAHPPGPSAPSAAQLEPSPTASAGAASSPGSAAGFDVARLERIGVRFEAARRSAGGTTVDVVGALGLNRERVAQVSSHAAGRIVRVNAFVGQNVRRGQVLATVESPAIGSAAADYISKRAELQSARQNLRRQEELMRQQLTTGRELELAQAAVRMSEAGLQAAQTRLRAFGMSGATAGAMGVPLIAPMDGEITQRAVLLGSWIEPETEAFTIADLAVLWAELDVFEADLALLREGDRVTLDVPSLALRDVPGVVQHIHAEIDRENRMGHVRVTVQNPDGRLRAGLSVTAHVQTQPGPPALRVPIEAVRERDGQPHVLQRFDGEARWTRVEIGVRRGSDVEITRGIAEGDQLAVTGLGLVAGSL